MCVLRPLLVSAKDSTMQGNVYVAATANYAGLNSFTAGSTFGLEFLLTDEATNATIGNIPSACIQL